MTVRFAAIAALPALLSLSACVIVVDGGPRDALRADFQSGDAGAVPPADAVLERFDALHAAAGSDVTVLEGDSYRLVLDDRAVATATYRVSDDTLKIACRKPCRNGVKGEATLYVPRLSSLKATSGASVRVEDTLPAPERLTLRASSGGSLDARAIPSPEVEARASSGGSIKATAPRRLDAKASSGGSVTYYGSPQVDSATSSGGSVRRGGGA